MSKQLSSAVAAAAPNLGPRTPNQQVRLLVIPTLRVSRKAIALPITCCVFVGVAILVEQIIRFHIDHLIRFVVLGNKVPDPKEYNEENNRDSKSPHRNHLTLPGGSSTSGVLKERLLTFVIAGSVLTFFDVVSCGLHFSFISRASVAALWQRRLLRSRVMFHWPLFQFCEPNPTPSNMIGSLISFVSLTKRSCRIFPNLLSTPI
mmetsp:Transcript_23269/g.35404  ORF Transcript_23269/g.35404 Transcript_23269/m.35404 type:complete len:204 (-) Transcript_23269:97-708(-)